MVETDSYCGMEYLNRVSVKPKRWLSPVNVMRSIFDTLSPCWSTCQISCGRNIFAGIDNAGVFIFGHGPAPAESLILLETAFGGTHVHIRLVPRRPAAL